MDRVHMYQVVADRLDVVSVFYPPAASLLSAHTPVVRTPRSTGGSPIRTLDARPRDLQIPASPGPSTPMIIHPTPSPARTHTDLSATFSPSFGLSHDIILDPPPTPRPAPQSQSVLSHPRRHPREFRVGRRDFASTAIDADAGPTPDNCKPWFSTGCWPCPHSTCTSTTKLSSQSATTSPPSGPTVSLTSSASDTTTSLEYMSSGGSGSAYMTTSAPSTTSSPVVTPDHHPLTGGQVAGIIVGTMLGVLLLGVFLWLLRKGTFGSGTLFGFKYGDARFAGWPGHRVGVGMEERESERVLRAPLARPPPPTLPPSSNAKPRTPLSAFAFVRSASTAKRPLSPTAWSTSPSAFDNVYGVAGSILSTTHRSASASVSISVSDLSTLVSEPIARARSGTAVAARTPPTRTNTRSSVAPTVVSTTRAEPSVASEEDSDAELGVIVESWDGSTESDVPLGRYRR